ncbi:hypothetical protein Bca101_027781 [Brassica carinata]
MAPDACVAAPRAPHVLQHGQDSCKVTPLSCLDDQMACCMTGVHARRHTISTCRSACFDRRYGDISCFWCVKLHVLLPCTSTPPPCVDTQLVRG